jgi:nucleotide-binding universal stress UspA family protein
MKKVLIALDYNPCAKKIAETGYAHAKAMKAKICIVHAIADISYYSWEYSPIMGFRDFTADSAFKSLEEQECEANSFLSAVVAHLGDPAIETKVLDGKTAKAILDYVREWEANLVVMGAQSHNGFEKLLMGDVVATVLKQVDIPLLIIPTDKEDVVKRSVEHNLVMHI